MTEQDGDDEDVESDGDVISTASVANVSINIEVSTNLLA